MISKEVEMVGKFLSAVLLTLALPAASFAGGFCCQVSTGDQSGFSKAGDKSLGVDYNYSLMDRVLSGGEEVSISKLKADPRFKRMVSGKGGSLPISMDMQRINLAGSYAVTDKLVMNVAVPWVINDMTMTSLMAGSWGADMKMNQVRGLGDVTLTGSYRVYQDKTDHPTSTVYLGGGLKLPTGTCSVNDNRKRVHAHMQPGTGSWDPILLASWSKVLSSSFFLQTDAKYQMATANGYGYSFGDTLNIGTDLKYNVASYMNSSLGLSYFHSGQSDDPDNAYNGKYSNRLTDYVGYTGEDSLWISPGIQVMPFSGCSVNVKFQYPIMCSVPDFEQVTTYRITAGITYSF